MPSITPAVPLTPEDGDEPFDEDPTGDPAIPYDIPAPDTDDDRFKPLPPEPGEEPVIQ